MNFKDAHIVGYMHPQSGVHYHRILVPISMLRHEKTLVTNDQALMRTRMAEGRLDILLINRNVDTIPADELVILRHKYGFKIVLDLDDYWNLDPHHVLFYDYEHVKAEILKLLPVADVVTVTHKRLADKCREVTSRPIFVLPNALPYDMDQFADTRTESERGLVRLGWAGGVTHEADINLLRGPMLRMADDSYMASRVEARLFGYNEGNPRTAQIWQTMASAFTASGRLPFQVFPPLAPKEYMAAYSRMDVALVPLVDSTFNSYKSNLKILEAGAKRIPVVCSQVLPYYEGQEIPGVFFCENQRHWFFHVKRLVKSETLRYQAGQALGDWVREHYSADRWAKVRQAIFENIIN
jgi:glycosyltransferase involved in cell wall biosynthesis